MQIVSQNSTSTDDSVHAHLSNKNRPIGLKKMNNNFLSDATHSENEYPLGSQKALAKTSASKTAVKSSVTKSSASKIKKKVVADEPLVDIAEVPAKSKQIVER